jgi:hypothetical protein
MFMLMILLGVLCLGTAHAKSPAAAGTSGSSGNVRSSQFRITMRIVSSCKVFVTAQFEVRSSCSYAQTPPPQIMAIVSLQNSPVSDQVREYSVTF